MLWKLVSNPISYINIDVITGVKVFKFNNGKWNILHTQREILFIFFFINKLT